MRRTTDRPIAIVAERRRNADVLSEVLTHARVPNEFVSGEDSLADRLETIVPHAGALLVTERALAGSARDAIVGFQDTEPVWSELPVVLLSPRDRPPAWAPRLRNVILVRQPSSRRQLLSVVHLARELRLHQFEVQDLLLRLEEQRTWLEQTLLRTRQRMHEDEAAQEELENKLASVRRRLNQRREEDRQMLSRELHDTVIQRLLYLSMRLAPGQEMARDEGRPELQNLIEEARQEAHTAVKELRRLIRELRPAGLELGFEAALDPMVSRLSRSARVEMQTAPTEDVPNDVMLCLYRVAQEALRNVERHADATRVRVALRRYGLEAHLLVADDGSGFEVPDSLEELAQDEHYGVLGMLDYTAALSGDLKIRSTPGRGTCLRARIPVELPEV